MSSSTRQCRRRSRCSHRRRAVRRVWRPHLQVERVAGNIGPEHKLPVATPHRPAVEIEIENVGVAGDAALDRQSLVVLKAAPRVVGDGDVGNVPFQGAAADAEDDVLEAIAIARVGEKMAGEIPPLDGAVVRTIIARELDWDRGVGNRRCAGPGRDRGDEQHHQAPDRGYGPDDTRRGHPPSISSSSH